MSETEATNFTGETNEMPLPPPRPAPSPYGGGQGRYESMEARVASIEAHVDHMRDDIGDIRGDLRELTKTIHAAAAEVRELGADIGSHPGRGWMTLSFIIFTAITCAVIIYLEQIRQYLGVLLPTSAP